MYKYGAKLLRVVDGDTADVMIDLDSILGSKQDLDSRELILGKKEQGTKKRRLEV